MRPGRRDHAQRFAQRAALGELDVDPVHRPRQPGNVRGHDAALVHDHGQDAPAMHGRDPLEVVRRKGLLHEFDAVLLQDRQHLQRAVARPPRVGVHPERLVGDVADGAQDLLVALRAELDFENRIGRGLGHLLAHFLRRIEADREGGARRAGGIEPPQLPDGLTEPFAHEVMQGRRERGPRRAVLGHRLGKPRLRRLQIERVAGQLRCQALQHRQHRVRRFAVVARRVGFTPTLHTVRIREPHPHHPTLVVPAPRDHERVLGLQRDHLGGELHAKASTWARAPAASRSSR